MAFSKEFTIHRGQTVEFAEGLKLTFEGHSHKRTLIGGSPSSLIVYVGYEINGGKIEQEHYNTEPRSGRKWGWRWRSHAFYITKYEYDTYMNLEVVYEPDRSVTD